MGQSRNQKEMEKYFELNKSENTASKNLWEVD